MEVAGWLTFLGAVLVGSYVQAVSGFALGMIVMAVAGASGTLPLPVLTAAVSLISLLNVTLALFGHTQSIDRRMLLWLALGQIPAIAVGVSLLTWLDRDAREVLELLLGAFITLGSLSMMIRPRPLARRSSSGACLVAGLSGGVVGGLFSASGPIMGWFTYRQPLPLAVIRATLLCSFALTTSTRTVVVGLDGGLTGEVLVLSTVAFPLVLLGTWLGRELPPAVSEDALKRLAFALLLTMGIWLILAAIV